MKNLGRKNWLSWIVKGSAQVGASRLRGLPSSDASFDFEFKRALSGIAKRSGSQPNIRRRRIFESATELVAKEFPSTPWLIEGLLVQESVAIIGGEPKSLKTWAAIEMAIATATGMPAFGRFSVPKIGTVAMLLAEDNEREVRNRLLALAKTRGMKAGDLSGIHVECRGNANLQSNEDLALIVASCRCLPQAPSLLVLDPLRDLHRAEENESGPMADVMGRLRFLRDALGCAVLVVHHTAKISKDSAARTAGQNLRGSTAIHGAIDGGVYLRAPKQESGPSGEWTITNSARVELKAARGAPDFKLSLSILDEAGEAVSATWLVQDPKMPRQAEPLETNVEKVLRVMRNLTGQPTPQNEIRAAARIGAEGVRAALTELEARGIVVKKQGRGWVIAQGFGGQCHPVGGTTETHPLRGGSEFASGVADQECERFCQGLEGSFGPHGGESHEGGGNQ